MFTVQFIFYLKITRILLSEIYIIWLLGTIFYNLETIVYKIKDILQHYIKHLRQQMDFN